MTIISLFCCASNRFIKLNLTIDHQQTVGGASVFLFFYMKVNYLVYLVYDFAFTKKKNLPEENHHILFDNQKHIKMNFYDQLNEDQQSEQLVLQFVRH